MKNKFTSKDKDYKPKYLTEMVREVFARLEALELAQWEVTKRRLEQQAAEEVEREHQAQKPKHSLMWPFR